MAVNVCMENCTEFGGYFNGMISVGTWTTSLDEALDSLEYRPWMFSLFGSVLVGLAGIFPLLVIHIEEGNDLKTGAGAETLQLLLSFAVGGLLGDVFLHLLPEAWTNSALQGEHATDHPSMNCGLWVLSGFLVFVIVEKIFAFDNESDSTTAEATTTNHAQDQSMILKRSANATSRNKELLESENNNCLTMIGESPKNGLAKPVNLDRFSNGILDIKPLLEKRSSKNGFIKKTSNNDFKEVRRKTSKKATISTENCNGTLLASEIYSSLSKNGKTLYSTSIHKDILAETITKISVKAKSVHVTGYLNLMANCIDNFTHGLAVGGSFLVSFRLGALTTFAILVHEIPHEVGDFAILLRSGFSRWDAARAQLLTASGGIIGALTAVWCSGGGVKAQTSWILPFTAGGFLHIGMVTILPELLKESSPRESMKQLGALCFGVVLMAVLTILCD